MEKQRNDAPLKSTYRSPEDAERAFYSAFGQCDLQAMGQVWADEGVLCVHPGSTLLQGRTAVLRSWSQILGGASKPSIQTKSVSRLNQGGLAVHVVEEYISPGGVSDASPTVVLATNIFRHIDGAWYIVGHHASLPLVNTDAEWPQGVLH